jgi:hypothetical protein
LFKSQALGEDNVGIESVKDCQEVN